MGRYEYFVSPCDYGEAYEVCYTRFDLVVTICKCANKASADRICRLLNADAKGGE